MADKFNIYKTEQQCLDHTDSKRNLLPNFDYNSSNGASAGIFDQIKA